METLLYIMLYITGITVFFVSLIFVTFEVVHQLERLWISMVNRHDRNIAQLRHDRFKF